MIRGTDELHKFLNRRTTVFAIAFRNLATAWAKGTRSAAYLKALEDVRDVIRNTIILSKLNGRRRTLLEARTLDRTATFALGDKSPISFNLPFQEAIDDLLNRTPEIVPEQYRAPGVRAQWVAQLYSEENAFAAALSTSEKLTKRLQKTVSDLIARGLSGRQTEQEILKIAAEENHNWSAAYAETVYQTNASSAYDRGREEMALDPDVREVAPAFIFRAIEDFRTRPNHAAADGMIASVDDPAWDRLKPPLGYRCRCGRDLISKFELQRMGRWKDGRVIPRYPDFNVAKPDGPPFTPTMSF